MKRNVLRFTDVSVWTVISKSTRVPILTSAISLLLLAASAYSQGQYGTDDFGITVDARGQVISLYDAMHGKERLALEQSAPLIAVKTGDVIEEPSSADFQQDPPLIRLQYDNCGVIVDVAVQERETHVSFEISRVEPVDTVEAIIWGPYPVDINQTVGEVIKYLEDLSK